MALLVLAVGCGEVSSKQSIDAPPTACVGETDEELCAAATDSCETHAFTDKCGEARSVDCGACAAGKGCVTGTCKTPVCSTFNYTTAPLAGMARPSAEDSLGAVTPDGTTILYIPSPANSCGNFQLVVADETAPGSGTYTQRDVTALFRTMDAYVNQDGHAITADGLTVITRAPFGIYNTSKKFVSLTRTAKGLTDFGAPQETWFAAINAQLATFAPEAYFQSPVISADSLEFLYNVAGDPDADHNGLYSTVRASATAPFPAGTKVPTTYTNATGISSDRLTLFVFDGFSGRILTRSSTSAAFANPNDPGPPPQLPNWQHKPSADCSKIWAMTSPGGCLNEDVVLMTRQ